MNTTDGVAPRWIILVDGDADFRTTASRYLFNGGARSYELTESPTGADGIRAALESVRKPDCILLDDRLPDQSALAVLAQLSEPGGTTVCPIVVLTTETDPAAALAMVRAGAQDCIDKSWCSAPVLARAVDNAIERWNMARELEQRARRLAQRELEQRELLRWSEEAHARLSLALEASRTGIWTWEPATDRVTWSSECYELHGISKDSFAHTGAAFFALVFEEDRARVEATVRGAIATRTRYACEFRVVRPDGKVVWVTNLGQATYDADGQPLRVTGTILSIDDRKRAQLKVEARERELQTLADNIPDIIARFDSDLRHTFVNAAVEAATGLPRAAFIGKSNRELGMPEEHCAFWEDAMRASFSTGQPRSLDFDFPTPSGTRYFEARIVPERGADGRVDQMLVVSRDVTERVKADRALRISEERLTRAQAAANVGTWDWNIATDEASWTPEAWILFTGTSDSAEPVTYQLWLSCVHPDDRAAAHAAVHASMSKGVYRDEFRVHTASPEPRWLEAAGQVLFSADGAPVRMIGTVRDITGQRIGEAELRHARAEAEQAVHTRDQLVAQISHDLRNPLGALTMGIAALEQQLDQLSKVQPERLTATFVRMKRQGKRMERLLDELLDVALMRSGAILPIKRRPTDLSQLVKTVAEDHRRTTARHVIEVNAEAPVVGGWDAARIERVVSNLISNAIKYSPNGGDVRIFVREVYDSRRWAVLEVSDSGIGIPEHEKARLFQWFSRADNARRASIAGIGIGLASAREIIQRHGGSITVQSEENKGASFTVKLPLELVEAG